MEQGQKRRKMGKKILEKSCKIGFKTDFFSQKIGKNHAKQTKTVQNEIVREEGAQRKTKIICGK